MIFLLTVKITSLYLNSTKRQVKFDYSYKISKNNLIADDSGILASFYEPKPNSIEEITADWLGYTVNITMNNDGLNDRFNYAIFKPKDTFRIITLGDSHTFGVYVQTKDNWPEKLEDLLNQYLNCQKFKKIEVINLGVHGYDLMYSFNRFKLRGLKYNPDLVIWFINNWNINNINEYYFPRREELLKMGYKDFNIKNSKYEIFDKISDELLEKYSSAGIYEYQKKVIELIKSIYNKEIIFISYNNLLASFDNILENNSKTNQLFSHFKLSFNSNSNKDLFFSDNHPNRAGYKKIAQEIYKIVQKEFPERCP